MGAAKAMLGYRERKKAEGWEPCDLCGALTDTVEMCITCRRYSEDGLVVKASQRLGRKTYGHNAATQ